MQSQEAHITLIPLSDKDPTQCECYHPISIISVNIKLFEKLMANRLQAHVPSLIHLEQVGFVP